MQLKQLLTDDEAVSPVIGVILMVAITVILAAVIASFVLGLGDQAGGVAPQSNFEFNFDSTNEIVTVTHTGGDTVRADELVLRGDQLDLTENNWLDNATTAANANSSTATGAIGGVSAVVSGDDWTVDLDGTGTPSAYVLRVVWEDVDGDTTSQLAEDRGPDA